MKINNTMNNNLDLKIASSSLSQSFEANQSRLGLDSFIKTIVSDIEALASKEEVHDYLKTLVAQNKVAKDGNIYSNKSYRILSSVNYFGKPYADKLKKLSELNLSFAPRLIDTIQKKGQIFIVTDLPNVEFGDLRPYLQGGKTKIPKSEKLKVYKELQKLTKAGLVDSKNLSSGSWYYTPDNRIVIPDWQHLRPISSEESSKEILEKYYQILFKE